ncbi:RNA-directed DNA polymerase, eukaryota [Tanacetum coccineum]
MTGGLYENTRRQFSSNEDFTKKISHSVFVTNFPDYVNSRDLWNKCSVYGTVIDVFIPNKKKEAGHRIGFVGSHQKKGGVTSYVSIVNGVTPLVQPGNSLSSAPALVLDEECVVERDFSNCAMGRVKSFDSITKLQSLLVDEGFVKCLHCSYLEACAVMFDCLFLGINLIRKGNLVNLVGILLLVSRDTGTFLFGLCQCNERVVCG